MLRLRTTITLSALLLVLGVIGTGWLTTLTAGKYAPAAQFAHGDTALTSAHAHAGRRRVSRATHAAQRTARAQRPRTWHANTVVGASADPVPATPMAPELVPLATPGDDSLTWRQLRGHLDGRVLLHVSVDGAGQVRAASVAQSSGDELLDTYALRSVWRWRFAVPGDSPDGLHGEVPVRYSSAVGMR